MNGIISSNILNEDRLNKLLKTHPSMEGMDLAKVVTCKSTYSLKNKKDSFKIAAIDYGIKSNILKLLNQSGCTIKIFPASASYKEIVSFKPDGIFLSNGPGDPDATIKIILPTLKELIDLQIPIFGICLGHQLISLALGAKTKKMYQGHRGANQPVKNLINNNVEITSQNHGFEVERSSLPNEVEETHISLFDGSNEGI